MTSLKQIAANRRNALHSTGPTSREGKERSRRNAVRHGLTAETVITGIENPEDYQAFEAAVIADYDTETAIERELVLRLASVLWRLRRASAIETALFACACEIGDGPCALLREPTPPLALVNPDIPAMDATRPSPLPDHRESCCQNDPDMPVNPTADLVDRYLRLAELPSFPLDRLSRYEHMLWRQARGLVHTLESLRRRRSKQPRRNFPFSFRSRTSQVFTDEIK